MSERNAAIYKNCIDGLLKLKGLSDLNGVGKLLKVLGNPQEKLKFVHVAGTNGKGSVCSYLNNILISAGYKTGMFTSPGIYSVTDRFKINGDNISEEELIEITKYVCTEAEKIGGFCEFQIMTCVGFLYFARHKCDIVVLETGIGGRSDSTNIIGSKLLAIITSIGMDHMELLGNTVRKIAWEKAGIISKGGTALCGCVSEEAKLEIKKQSEIQNASVSFLNKNNIKFKKFSFEGQLFDYREYKDIFISLHGIHQLFNAALSIDACEVLRELGYDITREDIYNGLKNTSWNGRMEFISENPLIIIDGAHNKEGAEALIRSLDLYFPGRRRIFVIGMMKDKDIKGVVQTLLAESKAAIAVETENPRCLPAKVLRDIMKEYCQNSEYNVTISEGLKNAGRLCEDGDIICICGSLYLICEVENCLREGMRVDKTEG